MNRPEIYDRLDDALNRLPELDRELVLRHCCGGEDYQRLAEAVGKSAAACQKPVARALDRLAHGLGGTRTTGAVVAAFAATNTDEDVRRKVKAALCPFMEDALANGTIPKMLDRMPRAVADDLAGDLARQVCGSSRFDGALRAAAFASPVAREHELLPSMAMAAAWTVASLASRYFVTPPLSDEPPAANHRPAIRPRQGSADARGDAAARLIDGFRTRPLAVRATLWDEFAGRATEEELRQLPAHPRTDDLNYQGVRSDVLQTLVRKQLAVRSSKTPDLEPARLAALAEAEPPTSPPTTGPSPPKPACWKYCATNVAREDAKEERPPIRPCP